MISEMIFEKLCFAHSRFCFTPLQVLRSSVVGGIRGSCSDSDRPSLM